MGDVTPLELARRRWTEDEWGEPRDASQERLWCLFYTNQEPTDKGVAYRNWNRPPKWVEDLVRT